MREYIEEFGKEIYYERPISHFIYGDSTDCFYWACQLAQTVHTEQGQDVFMTSATKENFMEGYRGEGCLVLLGVNPQDIPVNELEELLRYIDVRTFMDISTGSLHTIILTAHTDLGGMAVGYGNERAIWDDICGNFDSIYEVRNAGKLGIANVITYKYTPNEVEGKAGTLETKMIDRGIDLLQLLDQKNASNNYFEKFNYGQIWAGTPEERTCFLRQVKYLPIFEQQKLWAMMNSRDGRAVSPMFAKHCLMNLRSCEYAPSLRTVKDCGYRQVGNLGRDNLKSEVQTYINFERAGMVWLESDAHKAGQLTPYGYIQGLPPYEIQQEFLVPFDVDRLYFEPDGDDMWELGVIKLPF